jgi:uncharacterized protein YukE
MFFASSFFNTSNVWFNYLSNFFFAAAGILTVAKYTGKFFTRGSEKKMEEIEEEIKSVKEDVDEKLEQLLSQHRNNGGSSSKDQWDRLERKVDGLTHIMDRHLGYHEGLREAEES